MILDDIEIRSENFDYWFNKLYFESSAIQLNSIPDELILKINKSKKDPSKHISYYEKIYILTYCFGYKFFNIVIKDEGGIGKEDFELALKAKNGNKNNLKLLESMDEKGIFVLSEKDMADSINHISHTQRSSIYNLIKNRDIAIGMKGRKPSIKKVEFLEIINFILLYESRLNRVLSNHNISVTDWLVLAYYYDDKEKSGTDLYLKYFTGKYKPTSPYLRKSLYGMLSAGYLEGRGSHKKRVYRLGSKGIRVVEDVLEQILKKIR